MNPNRATSNGGWSFFRRGNSEVRGYFFVEQRYFRLLLSPFLLLRRAGCRQVEGLDEIELLCQGIKDNMNRCLNKMGDPPALLGRQ